jgi:alpha-mannosidase
MIGLPSATFRLIQENVVHHMTSWRVGDAMTIENLNETKNVVVGEINLGAVRKIIRYTLPFGQRSRLSVAVTLNDGSSMLDFDIGVDFHEVCGGENIPQLNFIAPVGYAVANYRYDVPFGTIDRPEIQHDVPANSYAAAISADGEDKPSVMVVTDTKYGFRGANNAIAVTLIRASRDPDPYPEYGKHNIRIGVGVVDGVANATLDEAAAHYVHPLAVCSARAGKGTLPMNGQLLKVAGNVRISSVKTAEDVDGLIVRLSDISGKGGSFKLHFAKAVASAQETDLNENALGELTVAGNDVCADVEAFGIKTVLVRF